MSEAASGMVTLGIFWLVGVVCTWWDKDSEFDIDVLLPPIGIAAGVVITITALLSVFMATEMFIKRIIMR